MTTKQEKHRTIAMKQLAEAAEKERASLAQSLSIGLEANRASLAAQITTIGKAINSWMRFQGFWDSDNVGEKIALMHSELSEALEADRKDLQSDKLEGYSGVEEELADCVIRILDFAAENDLRLGDAIVDKMHHNLTRPRMHGKQY